MQMTRVILLVSYIMHKDMRTYRIIEDYNKNVESVKRLCKRYFLYLFVLSAECYSLFVSYQMIAY